MMPIHLIELPSLALVSKADIAAQLTDLFQQFLPSWSYDDLWESDSIVQEKLSSFIHTNSTYGILSHRWLPKDELTFMDMPSLHSGPAHIPTILHQFKLQLKKKTAIEAWDIQKETNPGLVKILHFCKIAFKYDCQYVWFDTGCINKASSAELEESIRSMFNWYRNSKICIVHLAETTNVLDMKRDPWFTRGWTLQELLAPPTIKFYDKHWHPLTSVPNDKVSASSGPLFKLWEVIEDVTSIPRNDLLSFKPGIQNVRQRMTWAAKRTTTRIEDMAYCLIGIFNIPLSVAYGEGEMAFYRLQSEVMQRTNDRALFAWNGPSSVHNTMFAAKPVCFATPLDLHNTRTDTEYTLTNRGLRISLPFFEVTIEKTTEIDNSEYVLESGELGAVATISFKHQPTFTSLAVALLGDTQIEPTTSTSFAILLDFDANMKWYKRVATEKVLIVKRPQELQHKQIFII